MSSSGSDPDLPVTPSVGHGGGTKKSLSRRKGSEWEILANLDPQNQKQFAVKPRKYEGHLSKKRKWPLKGWHKRY